MKYKERDELVSSLRELADLIEEKGLDLPRLKVTASASVAVYDRKTYKERQSTDIKREVKQIVRTLKPVKKSYYGTVFYVTRTVGVIDVQVTSTREAICVKVPTGNKIIHAATYLPERVEEEHEWVCTDPLLKATED